MRTASVVKQNKARAGNMALDISRVLIFGLLHYYGFQGMGTPPACLLRRLSCDTG